MNAEKLYFLAKELQNELNKFETIKLLQDNVDLIAKWNNVITSYDKKELKEKLNSYYNKDDLEDILDKMLCGLFHFISLSKVNFHSAFKLCVEEIGISDYFGLNIKNKIIYNLNGIISHGYFVSSQFNIERLFGLITEISITKEMLSKIYLFMEKK